MVMGQNDEVSFRLVEECCAVCCFFPVPHKGEIAMSCHGHRAESNGRHIVIATAAAAVVAQQLYDVG